jgi:HPt (histidine-containing phosphotransfer) domain-containing protein
MDSIGQPALQEALDRLWAQFLPEMQQRVAILETATAAFAAGRLSAAQQAAAHAAAHKLAGVLGTFGLTRGTVLARELEMVYSIEYHPGPAQGERVLEMAAELRGLVESRK